MRTAADYRRLAEECDRVAAVISDASARNQLRVEAEQYRQTADRLDAKNRSRPTGAVAISNQARRVETGQDPTAGENK